MVELVVYPRCSVLYTFDTILKARFSACSRYLAFRVFSVAIVGHAMKENLNGRRKLTWPVSVTSFQYNLTVLAWEQSKMLSEVTEAEGEADVRA